MRRQKICGIASCVIITAIFAFFGVGHCIRLIADENPPMGDPSKFGSCEDKEEQSGKKCEPETGNCLEYTMGSPFVLGTCVTFSDVGWPAVPLPNGTSAKSAKAIESRSYGYCNQAGSGDKCQQCGKYWCAKAKFWTEDGCTSDVAPVTYAVASSGMCDPN